VEWAVMAGAVVVITRFITVFPTLQSARQGLRASLIPAVNLAQVSELSMVIVKLGADFGHVTPKVEGIIAYSFVLMGVASTYAINLSDPIFRRIGPMLNRIGFKDLNEDTVFFRRPVAKARIFVLGFSWTASSLLEEIGRHAPTLIPELI